ncbi:MAG: rRNA (adenine2030-N6)-methyltransferase [Shewanella sp.]|uniref:23S rRNA (adenine(2030)-N(6))-methyltransferase RlmJ n=1 Tax=Shewanella TaxID=22 RepID=UPI00167A9F91|nr:23S rRNA (adenine(2030)-N(6))-methyltransferase RlmJ [Shewanella fodinae]MCL2906688.1 23S rRNA (adenine(2030)-N(6))-methyltransferase RlmJ [Shewanella fodinae]MDN5370946.1 rRNA (adenine2030-N6)-methyltransferase [Shewanella sp.]GGZ03155.1 ribosomal RNA large subunit methyltransferase J [Shewanella fodinae]
MLSYRHGYHAGNYADVLKHAVLLQTLSLLQKKDKGLVYIDTHAGAGGYSLNDEFAEKTGEYRDGVGRLWSQNQLPESLQLYLDNVRHFNENNQALGFYPGSPALIDMNLRPQDRMVLHELHPTDQQLLTDYFDQDPQVKIVEGDGLKGLIAALPPKERRGLVLIDPSYEIKTDYQLVAETLIKAYRKFATGVYLLWYPVVQRQQTEAMLTRLKESGIRRQLRIEQSIRPDNDEFGMTAAGLWVINPPWQLDNIAAEMLATLQPILQQQNGSYRVTWEVGE